jgi:glycosyltransferase involved in cell wall biosynthesis
MSSPRLLVDVTQYGTWPATTGVQRVLLHLARDWSDSRIEGRFGFLDGSAYVAGALGKLGSLVAEAFAAGEATAEDVRTRLREAADQEVAVGDVEDVFDGYFLPEPSLRPDSLAVAARMLATRPGATFFGHFDALPLTHPELYPHGADRDGVVTKYHQIVSRAHNVFFISRASRETFEHRFARRSLRNAIVAPPGADSLAQRTALLSRTPTFAVLGTVEPRKRHRVVLDAFEQLWAAGREYHLVVLGGQGWEKPDVIERLRMLSRTGRLEWLDRVGDDGVSAVLARAWAAIFTPYSEGYGLPPLEALAAGCPVIVSANLPAFAELDAHGQIRLQETDADGVASAVERLANPHVNEEFRRALGQLRLPTWRGFVDEIEQWIARTLGALRKPVGGGVARAT